MSSLPPDEKEQRRKKQKKRMEKILAKAWQLDESNAFQDLSSKPNKHHKKHTAILCLTAIGTKLDQDGYRLGRHGWEDFAKDLGGVYNRHVKRYVMSLLFWKALLGFPICEACYCDSLSRLCACVAILSPVVSLHSYSRTKQAALAKQHLETVKELLGGRDQSLIELAANHVPDEEDPSPQPGASSTTTEEANASSTPTKGNKRRRSDSKQHSQDQGAALSTHNNNNNNNNNSTPKKAKHHHQSQNRELADREDRAMELLASFLEERGATKSKVQSWLDGFSARVTKKRGAGHKYDTNFYNANRRRFRSMLEVGRFFKLVNDGGKGSGGGDGSGGGNGATSSLAAAMSKVQRNTSVHTLAEKKRLRKELERLRKAQIRASKALDDFDVEQQQGRAAANHSSVVDVEVDDEHDDEAVTSDGSRSKQDLVTRANAASARLPDMDGFPGVPAHCVPDVLLSWDFLGTFERALSLTPIALDDFAAALTYQPPPPGSMMGDDAASPPVYLAEAHLGLLKMLLQDAYSDDWWWSVLETEEMDTDAAATATVDGDNAGDMESLHDGKPVIKVDVKDLLHKEEDPLITLSWLKALEPVGVSVFKEDAVKQAIKTALKVCANKWVHAYLRKALETKTSGKQFMVQAVLYLVSLIRKARPDLTDRSVKAEAVEKAIAGALGEAEQLMQQVSTSAPTVTSDDAVSDYEYEEDDESDAESDEEDDEAKQQPATSQLDASKRHASVIPPRPCPSYTDMLLPPTKPHNNSEYVNAFTWPHILGATAHRILHRKKRLLNETDDYMRSARELPPLLIPERRQREAVVSSRVLTECADQVDGKCPTEHAIDHLCAGGDYLKLTTTERLCLLRLLIEAAYDSSRLYSVVDGNIKQRTNATKALEVEQRRAKREAKEKAAADEAAAREQLALEARDKFFDEKRDEIRKLNDKNKEISDEIIESLTEEDILDFDEDFKADFDALPKPESFNKTEVKNMVARIQEETAFDTDSLRVLTLEELVELEKRELEGMEGELLGMGGEQALFDESLDRETIRSIERLQRDIIKAKDLGGKLPEMREKALEQLRDAMADGTIKVLRSAVTAAKKAKLSGPDDETGGLWTVDLLRDAALELENAKQNKRVLDAQRDLVAKMNKCFIRSDPIGYDRFRNRFWKLDQDEEGHVWVEAEYVIAPDDQTIPTQPNGFVNITSKASDVVCGAPDMETDMLEKEEVDPEGFRQFCRQEYHSIGFTPTLAKTFWGCHATEESIRGIIKILDGKRAREKELKKLLKESVEQAATSEDKHDAAKDDRPGTVEDDAPMENGEASEAELNAVRESGDEDLLRELVDRVNDSTDIDESALEVIRDLATAIGSQVRVRHVLDASKDAATLVRYESGVVTGWKYRREEPTPSSPSKPDIDDGSPSVSPAVPVWRVSSDRGHVFWLTGPELVESLGRFARWSGGRGYLESDAASLSYRNALGRYCGKASEAAFASSPIAFARFMVRREGELYPKLKVRAHDPNAWGGKSGARALWTNSMKDYAFDFATARQGLLTLEEAFFELTGRFDGYPAAEAGRSRDSEDWSSPEAVRKLLTDPSARHDLELETIERVPGLWNSPLSRTVFVQLVNDSSTTGFLALALDQLCRNTAKYLQAHKQQLGKAGIGVSSTRGATAAASRARYAEDDNYDDDDDYPAYRGSLYEEEVAATTQRRTRGMRKQVNYEEFF